MMKRNRLLAGTPSTQSELLRQRAEAMLRDKTIDASKINNELTAEDITQLLYELQLQKIQLELQDEEIDGLRHLLEASQYAISKYTFNKRPYVEKELLEMIACGLPLVDSLTALSLAIEKCFDNVYCSVSVVDDEGDHLLHCVAPTLPDSFWRPLGNIPIKESAGSCGTAAFRRDLVVVEDIGNDPLWADYRERALSHGLRACWSSPIIDAENRLLGTFAIYMRTPGRPSSEHLKFIELASQIAIVAFNKERSKRAMRETERQHRVVLNSIPGLISRVDRDLKYVYVNDQFENVYERPLEQILGQRVVDVLGQKMFEWNESFFLQALAGKKSAYVTREVTHSGEERFWLMNLVPDLLCESKVEGFYAVALDITTQMQVQADLEEALSRLRKIASEVPGVVYQYRLRPDGSSCFPYASDGMRGIYSIDPEDVRGDASQLFLMVHPDDDRELMASIQKSANELSEWRHEFRILRADCTVRWIAASSIPKREIDGSTLWNGFFADITERKIAESALRTKTELLEITGRLAKIGGWELDLLNSQLYWTSETYRIHELDELTKPSLEQGIQFYSPSAQQTLRSAVQAGIEQGRPWSLELPLITAMGNSIWVLAQGFAVMENGKATKLIGAIQDITDRRASEAERLVLELQLRESQKLEAIGTLAGGIAHDFNNILTVILNNAELGRLDVKSGDSQGAVRSLEEIRKAGERAQRLVQQINSFSRMQPTEFALLTLAPIIEESAELLRSTLPARVELIIDIAENVPPVLADAHLIYQVILNLATNSMQAMFGKPGRISIWLDTVAFSNETIVNHPIIKAIQEKQSGPMVRLRVTDNGSGMDTALMERIFEPFFTTKVVGQGTGLGLSVVHGIVRSHGGVITVDSQLGVGTTFSIYLPPGPTDSHRPENFEVIHQYALESMVSESKPHILLIDDDEAVLSSIKYLLERLGCLVSDYTDQREALDAFCVDPSEFELVLVDYKMPSMSGIDVAREIRIMRSDMLIAITSGYIDNELRSLAEAIDVQYLIPKPCSVNELKSIVEKLISIQHTDIRTDAGTQARKLGSK